jgi:hypothetical protein
MQLRRDAGRQDAGDGGLKLVLPAQHDIAVSVAPGIRQVTVTPDPLSSARSAKEREKEKESRKALGPL